MTWNWLSRLLHKLKWPDKRRNIMPTGTTEKKESRFDVVKLSAEASRNKALVKQRFEDAEKTILELLPAGVSRTQAILKLEESFAWVAKSARVASKA